MNKPQFKSYEEFWPYYLSLHSKRGTQLFHTAGLLLGVSLFIVGILTLNWIYIGLALVCGYGFAWTSHFLIEKNNPAAWQFPGWSFLSEFKMAFLVLTRKI